MYNLPCYVQSQYHDVFVLLSPIFLSLYMAIKAYKGEPKTYTVSDSVLKLYMYFCLHSQSDGIQTIYIFALFLRILWLCWVIPRHCMFSNLAAVSYLIILTRRFLYKECMLRISYKYQHTSDNKACRVVIVLCS